MLLWSSNRLLYSWNYMPVYVAFQMIFACENTIAPNTLYKNILIKDIVMSIWLKNQIFTFWYLKRSITWNCLSGVANCPCFSLMWSTDASNPTTTTGCLIPSPTSPGSHLLQLNLYSCTHPPLGRSNSGRSENSSLIADVCFFVSFFFFPFFLSIFFLCRFLWFDLGLPYSSSSSAMSSPPLLLSPIESSSLSE